MEKAHSIDAFIKTHNTKHQRVNYTAQIYEKKKIFFFKGAHVAATACTGRVQGGARTRAKGLGKSRHRPASHLTSFLIFKTKVRTPLLCGLPGELG